MPNLHLPSTVRPLVGIVAVLAAMTFALPAMSAADAVDTPHPATAEPVQPATDAQQLMANLPMVPEIELKDAKVLWHGTGIDATIVGIDAASSDPLLDTAIGPLRVSRRLVVDHHTEVLGALADLVAQAKSASLSAKDLVLEQGLLTGPSLRNEQVMVVTQGVMKRQDLKPEDRTAEVARVTTAVTALVSHTTDTDLDAIGRHALEDVLHKLDRPDGGEALDEIAPSFARRVMRHGWLKVWFHGAQDAAVVAEADQALAKVGELRPVRQFSGDKLSLSEVHDAFGHGGWIFATPKSQFFAHQEARPEYIGDVPPLMEVVELPAGASPISDASKALSARLLRGMNELASWSVDHGFTCDADRWHAAVSPNGRDLAKNCIPPHILISGLDGEVGGLAVEKGLLRPVSDGSHEDADRFLSDAAKLLPDNAHLDLVGEYLFAYVYPSPDPKHPQLMGNKQLKGNVQQTVWQTCGNAAGGVMHGDCADIAEVYQVLTERQGRNPIIIGLPEHAACAWAEQIDQDWHVSVLQTGPPLEFADPVLPNCLEKAYKSFDPSMTFDANELPLLLRFSGEVSRSEWSLSWRIFKEPAYAKTMFDVQRDWHFETYQRGISTMKKLIAGGDDDNANYRELSGLYSFTGQYDLAAQYHRKAIERIDNPVSRLFMTVQLVGHLLNAGKKAEAEAAATDVLEKQMPALKAKLGASYLQVGLQLAGACLNEEGGQALRSLAQKTLTEALSQPMGDFIDRLSTWLASPDFNQEAWDNAPDFRSVRTLLLEYTGMISLLVAKEGHDALPGSADLKTLSSDVQRYIDGVAFHDVEDDSTVMERYAFAGRWYQAVQGDAAFDALLDGVAVPATKGTIDHAKRLAGAAQMTKDLPWIKASVPYWYGRVAELFHRDRTSLDAKLVARLVKGIADAQVATAALGLTNPRFEQQAVLGSLIGALVAHDEHALRLILHRIGTQNDKDLRDDAAQWLGDSARFLDLTWYGTVLAAWRDEVDYKPKYFWIAWRAALNKAPQQALMVAKLAAERFKDDSAFTEEYGFMKQLLSAPAVAPTPEPATPAPATPEHASPVP